MYSLLYNVNKRKTFIIYHLLCSHDFIELSTDIFKPLVSNYTQNVELIIYNMGNIKFNVIHLDGECIIYTDLYKMYNLNFQNNYVLGFYNFLVDGVDYLGIKSTVYINAGIILLNLKQ